MTNRPFVYISHAIRGADGNIEDNIFQAVAFVGMLQKVFPEIEWYCPAEHDLFAQTALENGVANIEQILATDLDIIENKASGLLVFLKSIMFSIHDSKGMELEVNFAKSIGLPYEFYWPSEGVLITVELIKFVNEVKRYYNFTRGD